MNTHQEDSMNLRKISPYLMSGFIAAVGLFFIATGFIGPTFLELQAPGSYYLLGQSIFFIIAAASTAYLPNVGFGGAKMPRLGPGPVTPK
jgi:hypothetical protein